MRAPPALARLGKRGLFYHLGAALLVGVFCVLALGSVRHESPTIDEPLHLTRGLAFWWTGDTRLSYFHPPLGNALAALPAALSGPRVDLRDYPGWAKSDVFGVQLAYVHDHYDDAVKLLARSRQAVIALAALLGVYIYAWCFRRYGPFTALAALLFYCLHPTVLAHARLMTTDLPVTVFSVIAVGEVVCYLERPRFTPLLTTGLALGAALSTKYSAVFLIPVMLLAGGVLAALGGGRFKGLSLGRRLGQFAGHALLTVVIATFCVNAAYRFERTGWTVAQILAEPEPTGRPLKIYKGALLEKRTHLAQLPGWLPIPLPYTYVFGAAAVSVEDGDGRVAYYLGQAGKGRLYTFFPVLLTIKSPASLIVILGAGAVLAARRRRSLSLATKVVLLASVLLLGLACRSRLASSARHLLPMMPLLCVLGGRALHRLRARRFAHPVPYRFAQAAAAASAIGAVVAYPHYLGFFNALCLGEERGHWISSSDDWGQDAQDLGAWLLAQPSVPPLYLQVYTPTETPELAALGVHFTPLKCGAAPAGPAWVVLHANVLHRFRGCYPWLTHATLRHEVNYDLRIYDVQKGRAVPKRPGPAPPVEPPLDEADAGLAADAGAGPDADVPEDPEDPDKR